MFVKNILVFLPLILSGAVALPAPKTDAVFGLSTRSLPDVPVARVVLPRAVNYPVPMVKPRHSTVPAKVSQLAARDDAAVEALTLRSELETRGLLDELKKIPKTIKKIPKTIKNKFNQLKDKLKGGKKGAAPATPAEPTTPAEPATP
ncbi:hypothetical protein GGTG_12566, partial [Gaeumannomyces tritici R3-111a-1]